MNRLWAFCPVCMERAPVVPGPYKNAGRQQWYWILDHKADGETCGGVGRRV
jgi:hypothetical protein